ASYNSTTRTISALYRRAISTMDIQHEHLRCGIFQQHKYSNSPSLARTRRPRMRCGTRASTAAGTCERPSRGSREGDDTDCFAGESGAARLSLVLPPVLAGGLAAFGAGLCALLLARLEAGALKLRGEEGAGLLLFCLVTRFFKGRPGAESALK